MSQQIATRDRILADRGFTGYTEYLKSPPWKRIREYVMRRDRGVCRSCGGTASEVHHASYTTATLFGNPKNKVHKAAMTIRLFALCRGCHERIHFDEAMRWRTDLYQATTEALG